MIIEQLNDDHRESVKNLFVSKRYMGVNSTESYFVKTDFLETHYTIFCDTYLSGLTNFKAFGTIENGIATSLVASYESTDNAEWYGTLMRSNNRPSFRLCLDFALSHYESLGKYKFYTAFNAKWKDSYRRFSYSKYNDNRYDYIDEYIVPAKTKCMYTMPWQVLFNRTMVPVDTIVRCSYLKREYRPDIVIGGNL